MAVSVYYYCFFVFLGESNNFQYTVGNTYTYTYETDTITKVEGATEEHSSLHIQAKADIEVISKCDFVLNVSLHLSLVTGS